MDFHYDSRKIQPGDTFICLPGGERFEADARARGAVAILPMTRDELGDFANVHFGYPSQALTVVGVTGTNGKTTVTHLVAQGLAAAGHSPAVLGTLNAELTTPESIEVARRMRAHLDAGGTHFVMEVSSHAIDQHRIHGIQFAVKLLTNITQDHLDYHTTFEAYQATKLTFMAGPGASIYPDDFKSIRLDFDVPLPGRFNYQNIQAAVAVLTELGIDSDTIRGAMLRAKAPAGRFEPIRGGQSFEVIVDYAHTPDGLENVAVEAKLMAQRSGGQLMVVFGCGGDRDRTKRPKMGRVAEQYADRIVVTSDNPRSEDPAAIIDEICEGLVARDRAIVLPDRRDAIRWAIAHADANDVVLVAGKGHETYQIIKGETHHFDDREECRLAIQDRLS
ncbi:UDP-N-acetylmuramoyl-L-alanyl-D-glutamate--2,6-diaminopimelate ligase [bacterium]|nr:UDP-N-acetylmuramoyl-L-alanyl-D-glutamate--2,6-diaminopimelate ligase [bacterium]